MHFQDSFLQSSEWESVQVLLGRKTYRLGRTLVIQHNLPLGFNYLYSPRPFFISQEYLKTFMVEIEALARNTGPIFLRIDPLRLIEIPDRRFRAARSIQPQRTTLVDLKKPVGEILMDMRPKTRYNIRLAERKGIVVGERPYNNANIIQFLSLLEETSRREGFRMHPREYYVKLPSIRSQNFETKLFFAECQGKVLVSAMVNFYRSPTSLGVATYLHGGSGRAHKELMAPHLLHWKIIQEAKERGFGCYDFWGIDNHRWPGLTRFKAGFGGKIINHPPSADLVFKPAFYNLYRFLKWFL